MAPGASFQTSDGGAFAMANRPNFPRQDAGASTSSTVSPAIVGAGVGAGVLILAIIVGVAVRIHIVRKRHQKAMAELEQGVVHSPSRQMQQIARPVSAARCGSLRTPGQAGWDALYSNETVNEPDQHARPDKRQRTSVSLPKRIRQSKPLRLKGLKHLSAIMEGLESPRVDSRAPTPPSVQAVATADRLMGSPKSGDIGLAQTAEYAVESDWGRKTNRLIESVSDEWLNRPESPRPNVLPSFAINSPSRYGAAIANDQNSPPKVLRSVSTGVLDTDGAVFGYADKLIRNPKQRQRPSMHTRSVSLGAPLSRPPSGPVPPIPVKSEERARQGLCVAVSRESSSSSMNSAGSSVLVTSPILTRHVKDVPAASPTVEEVVAEDDRAELKSVLNRQWQNPNITGPRPNANLTNMKHERVRSSVKGSIRYDSESALSNRLSSCSTSSGGSRAENRLSIPQIATADRISISRVSSSNSLIEGSAGRVQKVDTPPRRRSHHVSSVSASGSPAARDRRSSALRDVSGNVGSKRRSPRRQMSISTQDSNCSSNGNPFQWDTNSSNSLPKPSAMKGSPNARKNTRRHNFVRISTLTPEVLGPSGSLSGSSSPPEIIMDDILEERESDEIKREVEKERAEVERAVASERRRSRPPMPPRNFSSDSCLRIQTLRASLTPSSPTLSTWNAYDQYSHNTGGLSSHPSDSNMTVSPLRPSRNSSRQSNRSSGNFIIPKFPSPSKARASIAVTVAQPDTAPMPEFSIDLDIESPTLGFHDQLNSSSPFGLAMSSEDERSPVSPDEAGDSPVEHSPVSPMDMPSSPPLPISKEKEYDPGWLPVVVDLPAPEEEYDPASPPLMWNGFSADEAERSSGIWLPFAIKEEDEQDVSPKSRPTSYAAPGAAREQDDSPPLSPKTVPSSIPDLAVKKSREKLTSENASSMMAKLPEPTSTSNFLGTHVPVLAPPTTQESAMSLPQWQLQRPSTAPTQRHRRQRSVSNLRTPRPSTARAPPLPTIPQSSSPPAPTLNQRPATSDGDRPHTGPKGPRSAPAKSVLKNAMALRRMNSEIKTHRESRESRNFVRLGREPSPLLPWIGMETDDFAFDFDTAAGASSSSSSSPASSWEENIKPTRHGVPQVDPRASALDEVSFDQLEKVIEGALAGFDAEHQAWSSASKPKSSAYAYGEGYNTTATNSAKRNSNVWDDGEKFWTQQGCLRPESLELPQFRTGEVTPKQEKTVDPRLLSTPVGSIAATPRSLYDNDGFLKV